MPAALSLWASTSSDAPPLTWAEPAMKAWVVSLTMAMPTAPPSPAISPSAAPVVTSATAVWSVAATLSAAPA